MAAATASRPLTPLLHRHHPRSRRRASAVVVAAASTPDAEPTAAAGAGQEKKKTVDTRIHWSDPDEGWIGGGQEGRRWRPRQERAAGREVRRPHQRRVRVSLPVESISSPGSFIQAELNSLKRSSNFQIQSISLPSVASSLQLSTKTIAIQLIYVPNGELIHVLTAKSVTDLSI